MKYYKIIETSIIDGKPYTHSFYGLTLKDATRMCIAFNKEIKNNNSEEN